MPIDPDAVADALSNAATRPAEVEVDGRKVKGQPIPDLIQLDNHLRTRDAEVGPAGGIRISKFTHEGPHR